MTDINFDEIFDGMTTTGRVDGSTLVFWFWNEEGSKRFVHINEDEAFENGLTEECPKCGGSVGWIDDSQFHIDSPDDTGKCKKFPHAIGSSQAMTAVLDARQAERDFDNPINDEEEAA